MQVWIGTAGFSYPEWLGGYYPLSTTGDQMLSYYSQSFPMVELNVAYHRCPTRSTMKRIGQQSPPGFRFSVKVPKSMTHAQSDRDFAAFQDALTGLEGRVAMLVAQFPAKFHHSAFHCDWLDQLAGMCGDIPLGVEFRHWTWSRRDVPQRLEDLGITLISSDVPSIPTLFPRGLHRTGRKIYVRLHTRNSDTWFGPEPERHDYAFTDHQLREWADALERECTRCDEAYLIFNNSRDTQAIDDGLRMMKLLRQRTFLSVAPAFPFPEPEQLSLFDV